MLPIPGTGSVKHLEENVAAASITLTDDEFRTLDEQGKAAAIARRMVHRDACEEKLMSLSMYDVTVPAFLRAFANLSAILAKAEAHAKATGLDPNVYLEARLAPDMLPLTGQIQRASDTAKGCVVRLGAVRRQLSGYGDEFRRA